MVERAIILHTSDEEWANAVINNVENFRDSDIIQFALAVVPKKFAVVAKRTEVQSAVRKIIAKAGPGELLLGVMQYVPQFEYMQLHSKFKDYFLECCELHLLNEKKIKYLLLNCHGNSLLLQSLFRLPSVLSNFMGFCPRSLVDSIYFGILYKVLLGSISKLREILPEIIELAVLHNKLEQFFEKLILDWNSEIKAELATLPNNAIIIFRLMEHFHKFPESDPKIILEIATTRTSGEVDYTVVRKLVEHVNFGLKEAPVVVEFLKSLNNISEAVFDVCAEVWSNQSLSLMAPYIQHQYITYLLYHLIKLGWCKIDNFAVMEKLRKGIEQRMESEAYKQFAFLIWSQLCEILSIPKDKIFENVSADSVFKEEILVVKEVPKKQEVIEDKKISKEPVLKYDSEDSDNDSDFEPYSIQDDYNDLIKIKPPKYLYDCILGLDSDNPQRYEFALQYCESLIRGNPPDLAMYTSELIQKLMRCSNRFNLKEFDEYIIKSISALLVFQPIDSIKECIQRLYSNEASLGNKMEILDAINSAVTELSDSTIVSQSTSTEEGCY